MNKLDVCLCIQTIGIVPAIRPALRMSASDDARFAAEAVRSAGIPIAEINMSVPGAIDVIAHLSRNFPEMIVGADVLDLETANLCLDAGARFLTCPGFKTQIVALAVKRDVVVSPGALTPTEVITAYEAGADFVKIYPCSQVGGASYIKALKSSIPSAALIASGGVNQQTAVNFILAGASALGIGSELFPQEALHWHKEEQIRELARRFLNMVRDGRAEKMKRT